MEQYIRRHIQSGAYLSPAPQTTSYVNRQGWTDHLIGPHLLYSHRCNSYQRDSFDDTLHFHPHYELVICMRGNVDYVFGSDLLTPSPVTVVAISPDEPHNTRLRTDSVYDRHVLLFRPEAFQYAGKLHPLPDFLKNTGRVCFHLHSAHRPRVTALLQQLENALQRPASNPLLAFALTVELLSLLNEAASAAESEENAVTLPDKILQIKAYVDEHYATVTSVSDLAARLFYSREYVSRLFRRYYNVSVAGYLAQYRIRKSLVLLEGGMPVTQAALAVGFGSTSAFISAFKKNMGMLPSAFAKSKP